MGLPKLPEDLSEGLLDERYTISIPKWLHEELEMRKAKHGARAINAWLRSLWRYGLSETKTQDPVRLDLDYD